MIIYKQFVWKKFRKSEKATFNGYFLFGIIPIYCRQVSEWEYTSRRF